MSDRVLDSNVPSEFYREKARTTGQSPPPPKVARQWGLDAVQLLRCDKIVSPVRLEFVNNRQSREELAAAKAFISVFDAIDRGRVVPEDWAVGQEIKSAGGW